MKRISVKVTPKSKKPRVEPDMLLDKHGQDGNKIESYKIYVSSPPEDGKANREVIERLSEFFDVPKSKIKIVGGETSRNKIVEIR